MLRLARCEINYFWLYVEVFCVQQTLVAPTAGEMVKAQHPPQRTIAVDVSLLGLVAAKRLGVTIELCCPNYQTGVLLPQINRSSGRQSPCLVVGAVCGYPT